MDKRSNRHTTGRSAQRGGLDRHGLNTKEESRPQERTETKRMALDQEGGPDKDQRGGPEDRVTQGGGLC